MASILQLLAPLSWGFELWLIFLSLNIKGSAGLSCFPSVDTDMLNSPITIAQTAVGGFFLFMGMMLFMFSLGMITSTRRSHTS